MGPRNKGAVERRWAARRTPVADIFRGRTRVRLTRAAHHDVTDAVQPFFTLQLDIEVTIHLVYSDLCGLYYKRNKGQKCFCTNLPTHLLLSLLTDMLLTDLYCSVWFIVRLLSHQEFLNIG